MDTGRQLRLISFRSTADSAVLDAALRNGVLAEIARAADVVDAFLARHGPTDPGVRIVATVREPALDGVAGAKLAELTALSALDGDVFDPAGVDLVRLLPIAFSARFDRAEPPQILRIFRGTVLPGRLDEYIGRAAEGTTIDGRSIEGLCGLYLATEPPDDFVTLSVWRDWGSIELATGGNVRRPMATRHAELIARGTAQHYELVATAPGAVANPRPGHSAA
ncbi:MAG TPA: hypothetical protein VLA44_10010 [Clostridia bacterium]|nr:hypothetical protein [Clostridia bacterium]